MRSLVLFAGLLALCVAQDWTWDNVTPLDDYVNRDDPATHLEFIEEDNMIGCTIYVYNLTSQRWMDENYIDRPTWWHHLTMAIPDDATNFETAHISVTGGSHSSSVGNHQYICDFARQTGAVAAQVQQVPNGPLQFASNPGVDVSGDALIAKTWRDYIEWEGEDPNPDVILNLPMTKAGKVAMDYVISEASRIDDRFDIQSYIPTGISKRGWVAWLLACVDPRVIATAPTVFSILSWYEVLHHHNMAYGGWSFAFAPYWNENIPYYIEHERSVEIFNDIGIDPLAYNPRLTMPKLLSMATGDEFFRPDETHFFWEELSPPKLMTMYENTGHGMSGQGQRRDDNILSFFLAVTSGFDLPEVSWTMTETETEGYTDVSTDRTPNMIQSWWVDTTPRSCEEDPDVCRRDWRGTHADNIIVPINWVTGEVEEMGGDNNYRATYSQRDDVADELGYRGFFVQMEFDGVDGHILDVTTEINVLPENYPFERCGSPDECQGVLK